MYRVLSVCILMLVLVSNIVFPASASSIHYISNETELFSLENNPEATYVLTNDIYLESQHSMMFGGNNNSFKGVLDGNGYTVYNLKIESDDAYLAFIGFLDKGGVVKDLNFANGVITSQNENTYLSGVVAYNNGGRVENCVFRGSLSVAGEIKRKEHYVCAMGSGEVVNSFYYPTENIDNKTSSVESPVFTENVTSSNVSYTESVNVTSSQPAENNIPSSPTKSSSSSSKISSSSVKTESGTVYGDMSSAVSTAEEEKARPFVFYAAVFLLLLLLAYMVYTEIKFRKNQKNDKK